MAIVGAHMSIAGGLDRAVEAAADAGCDCVQIFTANPRAFAKSLGTRPRGGFRQGAQRWQTPPLEEAQAALFKQAVRDHQLKACLSHTSYLINIGSPDKLLRDKSVESLVGEVERATQLDIPGVVLHPGSYTTSSPKQGLRNIVHGLNRAHRLTDPAGARVLLETTAGQGTNLGWQFEQLQQILDGVRDPERLGVCLDTCHMYAAGYPLQSLDEYCGTMSKLDELVGLRKVQAIHLNDSKCGLGSRKDRHENIGQGELGLEPFRHLLNDQRFAHVPMYLETPKGDSPPEMDKQNLQTLRSLIRHSRRQRTTSHPARR